MTAGGARADTPAIVLHPKHPPALLPALFGWLGGDASRRSWPSQARPGQRPLAAAATAQRQWQWAEVTDGPSAASSIPAPRYRLLPPPRGAGRCGERCRGGAVEVQGGVTLAGVTVTQGSRWRPVQGPIRAAPLAPGHCPRLPIFHSPPPSLASLQIEFCRREVCLASVPIGLRLGFHICYYGC